MTMRYYGKIMMMSKIYNYTSMGKYCQLLIIGIICLLHVSCDNTFSEEPSSEAIVKCELIFEATIGEPGLTRGVVREFPDMAKIYVNFSGNGTKSYGLEGVYSSADDSWTIEFPEMLQSEGAGTCDVVYISDGSIEKISNGRYKLTVNTSVLKSEEAEWRYESGKLIVTAHLKPSQSRIRFVSDAPTEIWVKGFGISEVLDEDFRYSSYESYSSPYIYGSEPCYPKHIQLDIKGNDGKYYSNYYYSHKTLCEAFHRVNGVSYEYYDCPEYLRLSIFYPNDPDYFYYKDIREFSPGESYLVSLPSSSDYVGWTKENNKIIGFEDIQIGINQNMSQRVSGQVGIVAYGLSLNFELTNTDPDGYVYVSGTTFHSDNLLFANKKISALFINDWGKGVITFGFNTSNLTTTYSKFSNISITYFPIYDVYTDE